MESGRTVFVGIARAAGLKEVELNAMVIEVACLIVATLGAGHKVWGDVRAGVCA